MKGLTVRSRSLGAWITIAVCVAGCGSNGHRRDPVEAPIVVGPAPQFALVADSYNRRVELLDRFIARANLNVTYFDENGEKHNEQPEGHLQVVRPNRLALSLGRAGQTIFWFGCDPEKYWWLDMSESKRRIAAVGRHENFGEAAAQRIGLAIEPLDLIRVLAVTPLNRDGPGATQWSNDGRLLGITTPIGRRGYQRVWIDPHSLMPKTVEIFDVDKELQLVAQHEEREPVEQQIRGGSTTPMIPGRVTVSHIESGTDVRITMTGVRDGPISDKAFDFQALIEKFGVTRVIDVDEPRARVGGPLAEPVATAGR